VLFLEPPLRLAQPIRPRARDRPRLRAALLVEAALRLAQPPAPALSGSELGWQLVAAPLGEPLVLRRISRARLF